MKVNSLQTCGAEDLKNIDNCNRQSDREAGETTNCERQLTMKAPQRMGVHAMHVAALAGRPKHQDLYDLDVGVTASRREDCEGWGDGVACAGHNGILGTPWQVAADGTQQQQQQQQQQQRERIY